jgi:hypothetical protein
MEEVGFGLTEMAWNGERQFWDFVAHDTKKTGKAWPPCIKGKKI